MSAFARFSETVSVRCGAILSRLTNPLFNRLARRESTQGIWKMIRKWFSTLSVTALVCAACVSSPLGLEESTEFDDTVHLETAPPVGLSKTGIDYGLWRSYKANSVAPDTPEEVFKNSVARIFEASGDAELLRGLKSDRFQCLFTRVEPRETAPWTCRASAYHFSAEDNRTEWTWRVEFSGRDVAASHFKEIEFVHLTIEPR